MLQYYSTHNIENFLTKMGGPRKYYGKEIELNTSHGLICTGHSETMRTEEMRTRETFQWLLQGNGYVPGYWLVISPLFL